ncbi:hypothetical protein GLOIN_2v1784048 [Rhizophagus irregularis DAOM 181602=DAOM 197198]|uniref:Uncharacterized protein n=1 Tax=Rhizophagus irregularis (strain DAOM 181602 / DAOM 197198 / MUCL 43194) TaxID=747089 RepID=A0A2P4PDM8_RHIID|nr:hypothetical protein GLOIN_2v1784048 [Rhizophagus irregularis DAOM 181602=DAOM 197198]POG63477.1 hypothetical protein GLOIN_2v1784048 [Rhizophagus irregularis DAOM 181602=DAOM 197198]|eukprot:XP_025170343.1 hypothetical protein GLOIN_2v1784048 [Rhizophagus irregularis DAOM 181602=DAOM 197198]
MITWNDNDGAIFCKYKRKSKSKTFNSIGFYYKMEGSMVGNDNGAPLLKKCSECSKNIARNKEEDNCLIHYKEMNELKRMGMEELEEVNFLICFGVIIEINKYVVELENFRNEMSNREKIDFNNYTLLKFLYQIIAEKNLRVEFICDVLEETSAFNVKIEAMKKDLIDNASTMSDISILWNNLLVDEFNLRWKNFVIEENLLYEITRGLINVKIWKNKQYKKSDSKCDLYLSYIYERIWKLRCEEVVRFEKSQGMGKIDK